MSRLQNECASPAPSNIPSTNLKTNTKHNKYSVPDSWLPSSTSTHAVGQELNGLEWPWASTKPLEQKQNVETFFEDQIKFITLHQALKTMTGH